jgi:acyl-CoA synthetase (AMP-forming)/AMP-acid ligase II
MRTITIGDVLSENARRHQIRTAVVCQSDRYTYEELDRRVAKLADALRDAGVSTGDRVLWLGQNCHRVVETLLAAARLGAMMCPANWRQSAEELGFILDDLRPQVVMWQEHELGDRVREARRRSDCGARWIRHDDDGAESYETFLNRGSDDAVFEPVDPDSPVLVIYTAAFDGKPNGALLTHTNLLTQSIMVSIVQDVSASTVYLVCGPLFHVGTWITLIPTFHLGGRNVFTPRVEAGELCRLIATERCTRGFILLPTVKQLVELNATGAYDLSSFQSSIPIPNWQAMTSLDTSPGGTLPGGWGQTEIMGLATFASLGGEPGNLTKGASAPMALVRVVNQEGKEVADGELGELVVRGPIVGHGYWNRPELNAQRSRDGWWHTSDLGRRELDGTITFVGTTARMIKSAAENIYPAEVEACIESHPAVAEAAVIGVPDERWTQAVKAILVLKKGATATSEEIVEHCRTRIASYKKPKLVEFLDEPLPRVGPLKDYAVLDTRFGGGGYPGERNAREIA